MNSKVPPDTTGRNKNLVPVERQSLLYATIWPTIQGPHIQERCRTFDDEKRHTARELMQY